MLYIENTQIATTGETISRVRVTATEPGEAEEHALALVRDAFPDSELKVLWRDSAEDWKRNNGGCFEIQVRRKNAPPPARPLTTTDIARELHELRALIEQRNQVKGDQPSREK